MFRLLFFFIALAAAQSYNPCETSGSCCFDLGFSRTPGIDGVALQQGYEILPSSSPWGTGSFGIKVGVDPSMTRPGTANWLYSLGLLNTGSVTGTNDWRDLRVQGGGLAVVTAVILSPEISLLKANSVVLWANFTIPACLKSLSLLRSWALSYREGTTVTLYDRAGIQLDSKSFPWSLQVQSNWLNVTYTTSNVAAIRMAFTGVGYGAFYGLSACYPSTAVDKCGICGGNGSMCALRGPQPGDPCFNSSMSNSICQPGTYSANLSCIPTLYNVTGETCDGVDNDCDGVIDNGAPAISATCGVGACQVTVWGCKNGTGSNLTCVPGYPTPEVCDGVDNDCDGVIDNGNVCAQPVLGVAVVPIARCIEGRLSPSSTDCYAHFGYYNTDPFFAVTRPYPNGMYNSLTSYVPENTLCPMPTANVPQYFPPNASNSDAFRVAMCCADGASVVWSLGDGNDNFLQATVYASSAPPCETFVGQSSDLVLPISIFVDSPCVLRQNGTCSVALGYQNPNSGSPVYYVPAATGTNYFYVNDAPFLAIQPPSVFFQQRVRGAAAVQWPCPTGSESLRWTLTTARTTRQAVAQFLCR